MEKDFDTKFIMQGDPTIPLLLLISGDNPTNAAATSVTLGASDVPDESYRSLPPLPPSDFSFHTLQLLDCYDATPPPPTSFFTSFSQDYSSFNQHHSCYHQHQLVENLSNFFPQLDQSMSIPIDHPLTESTHQPTFDFFCSDKILPRLHSFESPNPQKRPRFSPYVVGLNVNAYSQTLGSVVESFVIHKSNNFETNTSSYSASATVPATAAKRPVGKKRREKLSERARRFQKLMRWDTKMDMATLLDEACKYLKFLKAQVKVHQSMPVHSVNSYEYFNSGAGGGFGGAYGHLGTLNRQQLLMVMSNSPAVQKWLYSQENCVFSLEQLLSLKEDVDHRKAAAVQFQKQQMLFGSTFADSRY